MLGVSATFGGKFFRVVVLGVLVRCFGGNICGDTPASPTMKGSDRKGISMCYEQGDLSTPRTRKGKGK